MIAVTQFITRFQQGYTEAFLCRGEDGHLHVAKSRRSGKESLVREWVCGRIAQMLALPIPPCELLYASASAAVYTGIEELEALAAEPGFGSRFVGTEKEGTITNIPTLNVADVSSVSAVLRQSVLLFDWWVLNFDRTDHNPNLLWNPVGGKLHVIDHNLAFDNDPPEQFWRDHIFRADRPALSDQNRRATDLARMNERYTVGVAGDLVGGAAFVVGGLHVKSESR